MAEDREECLSCGVLFAALNLHHAKNMVCARKHAAAQRQQRLEKLGSARGQQQAAPPPPPPPPPLPPGGPPPQGPTGELADASMFYNSPPLSPEPSDVSMAEQQEQRRRLHEEPAGAPGARLAVRLTQSALASGVLGSGARLEADGSCDGGSDSGSDSDSDEAGAVEQQVFGGSTSAALSPAETWFGQLVCFLETQPERGEGASQQRAYVRWLSTAPHSALTSVLPFSRLKWSEHSRPDGRGPSLPGQAWYSLVDLDHIIEPVFLQPDPTQDGYFFYNHYVR